MTPTQWNFICRRSNRGAQTSPPPQGPTGLTQWRRNSCISGNRASQGAPPGADGRWRAPVERAKLLRQASTAGLDTPCTAATISQQTCWPWVVVGRAYAAHHGAPVAAARHRMASLPRTTLSRVEQRVRGTMKVKRSQEHSVGGGVVTTHGAGVVGLGRAGGVMVGERVGEAGEAGGPAPSLPTVDGGCGQDKGGAVGEVWGRAEGRGGVEGAEGGGGRRSSGHASDGVGEGGRERMARWGGKVSIQRLVGRGEGVVV